MRRLHGGWFRVALVGLGLVPAALEAAGPAPRPFRLPKDRAAWEVQREEIRAAVRAALGGFGAADPSPRLSMTAIELRDGAIVASFRIETATGQAVPCVLALPNQERAGRLPAVLYCTDGDPLAPGPEGVPPPVGLARRGFAVLCRDARAIASSRDAEWGRTLDDDRVCLDYLFASATIDPQRVAVAGFGRGRMRAWWLTALDERIKCGSTASGLGPISGDFDPAAVISLCAPRSLEIMVGTNDPASPLPGVLMLRDAVRRAYSLVKPSGHHMEAIFGGLGHEFTLLEWDMMLELFDKELKPQGPTPLGHAPAPEPAVDARFLDPAAHGLAGWVPEMSQRPTTWRWEEGTIICAPGPNEYGWLRAPIEVDDFVFSVEWKIPKGGNTGIFLRARPVEWFIPPSPEAKWAVATQGLEWPSRTGLELQATDDAGQANKYSSGSLYRHAAPAENVVKPAGEWNRYTVRARGPRIEVWCNGRQVLDTSIDDHPSLRQPPLRGYIGLQNHGVCAEFRNLRYLRLTAGSDPDSASATAR